MAKKQKKATPKRVPTKHQLSKWQRQTKIRRIVIIAAVVFLTGILSWVGYESYQDYQDRVGILHDVVIEVNGVHFTMEYYVNTLEIYVNNYINTTVNTYLDFYMQAYNATREETIQLLTFNAISDLSQNTDNITDMITGQVADNIINVELLRQGAKNLDIEVTSFFEAVDADGFLTLGRAAGFPDDNGDPADSFGLNTNWVNNFNPSRAELAQTIAHEIGHAIGLRHTDFATRESCGQNINEDDFTRVGSVHIAGTPMNSDTTSLMQACASANNRIFNANDELALETIY